MDGTLIVPRSGKTWPKGSDDWKWWDDSVPKRLQQDHKDGKHIVILSNQAFKGPKTRREWRGKLPLIAAKVSDGVGSTGGARRRQQDVMRTAARLAFPSHLERPPTSLIIASGEADLQLSNVPLRVLAALEKDVYRKPRTGMIDHLRRMYEEKGWEVG